MCECGNMWSTFLSICAWVDIGHMLRQRSHSSMGGTQVWAVSGLRETWMGFSTSPLGGWQALGACELSFIPVWFRPFNLLYREIKATTKRDPMSCLCCTKTCSLSGKPSLCSVTGTSTRPCQCWQTWYASMPSTWLTNLNPRKQCRITSTVCVLQILVDQPIEAFRSPDLKQTIRGLAMLRQHQPKRVQAITPEMLCCMHRFINVSNTLDLVAWAAILVTFFCMLHKLNYVPESHKSLTSPNSFAERILQ